MREGFAVGVSGRGSESSLLGRAGWFATAAPRVAAPGAESAGFRRPRRVYVVSAGRVERRVAPSITFVMSI